MASSPMDPLFKIGRFQFFAARRRYRFTYPGVHVWTGKGHRWLLPTGKFGLWLRRPWRRSDG